MIRPSELRALIERRDTLLRWLKDQDYLLNECTKPEYVKSDEFQRQLSERTETADLLNTVIRRIGLGITADCLASDDIYEAPTCPRLRAEDAKPAYPVEDHSTRIDFQTEYTPDPDKR